jgi:hypothetical protein
LFVQVTMGLSCGHATVFIIENLTINNIFSLIQHRKLLRRLHDLGQPCVDVDASWVVRKFFNLSYDDRVTQLMRLCMVFIWKGCRVNIVFDGTTRHHSKRATTKRYVDGYKTKIEYQVARGALSNLNNSLKRAVTEVEVLNINNEITTIKKNRSME